MEFEQAYQHLNEAQREAVDYIDGPLLVIAGPGTGKTQLLSVRVANILKRTDVGPENILCLTFTETGASNMRHRLADFIGPEAYKVQIQTYHAFGSYILQSYHPELKTAIDELDQLTIIRDIQASLDYGDPMKPDYQIENIKEAIKDFKTSMLTVADLQTIVNRNQIDNDQIYSATEILINDISRQKFNRKTVLPKYHELLAAFKTFVDTAPEYIVGKIEPMARIYYRSLGEILLNEDDKKLADKLRKWRDKYYRKNSANYLTYNTLPDKRLASLAHIMAEYQNRLQSAGLFDYSDMVLNAIQLLKDDAEIRYNTQERFQYILLDEFQDTNDAQAQLVGLLTDNPSNEGKPNIMAVGDDDQAIYSFQGANVSNFYDFDQKYHPHHVSLTKNYRSGKAILDFAHNTIEQSNDRFCKAPNVNINKIITAENPPAITNIELREYQSYQSEYSFVAAKIHELIQQGIPGNRISVIAPKHKYLLAILPYLHALNIKVAYEKRENILEDPQISILLDSCKLLLALTQRPKDADPYWFRILALPHWQISATDNLAIIADAKAKRQSVIENLAASDKPKYQQIANFFATLATKIENYSADYIISSLSQELFKDEDNYEYYSNLNTLRELLASKNTSGQKLFLRDFCKLLVDYQEFKLQILNKSPYHEASDAIVLQTVHSSKGLEYDYVFLISLDNKNWSDASGGRDRISLPRNMEFVHTAHDNANEKLRVFFVAITRARAQLFLTYSLSDFIGHKQDRLKFLDIRETVDADGTKIYQSNILPTPFATVIAEQADTIATNVISPNKWIDDYLPDSETRRQLLLPKVEHFRLSPTHLNTFIDLKYSGPIEFFKRYILGISGVSSASLSYGDFVHEVMDKINKESLNNATALAHFHHLVDNADADETEKLDLHRRGDSELKQFLDIRGDQLRNTRAESERSFFSENIVLDGIPLTGQIDRIEIDDDTKTITVSDFKTGRARDKWKTNDSTFTYKIQLYFYKFLLENSHEYRNYKVTKGRLDWVSPDEYGNTISLELTFKDAEAAQVRKLIQIVYHHIKQLDFPDSETLKKASNPTKAFFDQLLAETPPTPKD